MSQESKRFKTPSQWNTDFTEQTFFNHLKQLLPLNEFSVFPSVEELNCWAGDFGLNDYRFVEDAKFQTLNAEDLYYEQFIHKKRLIPTRENNWHDLFNACIWLLFPKSKSYLNQIHMSEIAEHGLNPRTPVRNRVTHFDECGGILVYQDQRHLEALQNHRWREAFVEKSGQWNTATRLYIFGHANYEMLLAPYIGLTGKYLPVKVDNDFWQLTCSEQYQWLDSQLLEVLKQQTVFQQKGYLKPIPLLGIPGWWPTQNREFYDNTDYFRPLRK